MLTLSLEAQQELNWWQQHLQTWNGRCPLRGREQVIICSDASLSGWGATCKGIQIGGPWLEQEKTWHINCLELQAAFLAIQTFLRDQSGVSVMLQMDNTAAVAYINNLGEQLTSMVRSLWLWALQKDIVLIAQHIPGGSNLVADMESRMVRYRTWKLNPAIFSRINQSFGPLGVDLYATKLTHQLPRYFSWRPDPQAEAMDAFLQDWGPLAGFANPPWCLMGRVLSQVMEQKAQIVLVAPVWKRQPWYPVLLDML